MNYYIKLLLIILGFVVLAHLLNFEYEDLQENNKDSIEHLVESDSDYSNCDIGCIIACSDRNHVLNYECHKYCEKQCWNY